MEKQIPWHRLFGIGLTDFFTGTSYKVELEKDLSLKQQFLDILIIEAGEGKPPDGIPDGLENLASFNLLTYKSHQDTLDDWALNELIGHYVNYRKQISSSFKKLVPENQFKLYAVSTRYPAALMKNLNEVQVKKGVYDVIWGSLCIRLIVLNRISKVKRNALWHIFSAIPDMVKFGASEYKWRTPVSLIMNELIKKYNMEGVLAMPYTMKDFERDCLSNYIHDMTPDELEDFLKGIPAGERLKGIPAGERLKGIPAGERLKGLSADEYLKSIPANTLVSILKKMPEPERKKILKLIHDS